MGKGKILSEMHTHLKFPFRCVSDTESFSHSAPAFDCYKYKQ